MALEVVIGIEPSIQRLSVPSVEPFKSDFHREWKGSQSIWDFLRVPDLIVYEVNYFKWQGGYVAKGVNIPENLELGDGSVIGPGVIIGNKVRVGPEVKIYPGAELEDEVNLEGKNIIGAGSVIKKGACLGWNRKTREREIVGKAKLCDESLETFDGIIEDTLAMACV
ncbi:MAG: hypothetical protein M1150_04205 [Patescibacteria group bacterium]|nr:hypothetical protein [Patescibacteria group bacterium]